MERVGAKRRLRDFQDSFRAMERTVPETVPEAFKLATEFVNQEVLADAGSSNELVCMRSALSTAQAEAKMAQDQLVLLQQKYDTFKGDLHK